MENVSRDEQRHIGFGVKVLSELIRETDECKAAIDELLGEVMPWVSSVFVPPGWNLDYTRCYGFEIEDLGEWGMKSIEQKWRAIGYPMDEMPPAVNPLDMNPSHRERAEKMIGLAKAGVIGQPLPPEQVDSSPETQASFFDLVARTIDTRAAPARRSRCSGSSATPSPGTSSSTTARPAPCPARRRAPTSRSSRAGPTSSTSARARSRHRGRCCRGASSSTAASATCSDSASCSAERRHATHTTSGERP